MSRQKICFSSVGNTRKRSKMRVEAQTGRSLTEMLATLAIMGVLTITAVASFSYAMNRHRANQIIHDARVGYMDEYGSDNAHKEWTTVKFHPECEKPMYTMRDKMGQIYVKVNEVGKDVCWHLLRFGVDGSLGFYTEENEEMTTCPAEENNIIIAFNGVGAPAECIALSDCGEDFEGICNGQGHCQICDESFEMMNEERTACECNPEKARSCSNKVGDKWCCLLSAECGEKAGSCIQRCESETAVFCKKEEKNWCCNAGSKCSREAGQCSDGKCWATYEQEEGYEDELCELSYTQTNTEQLCQVEFSTDSASLSIVAYDTCGNDTYCYVMYANAAHTANIGAASTGTLYGTCSPLGEHNTGDYTMRETNPCSGDRYCYVMYTNAAHTANIGAASTGTLYGTCSPLGEHNMTGGYRFIERGTCSEDEYCRLQWRSSGRTCPGVQESTTGSIYGVCLPIAEDNFTCPYK